MINIVTYSLWIWSWRFYDFKPHWNQLIYWIMLIVREPAYVNEGRGIIFSYYCRLALTPGSYLAVHFALRLAQMNVPPQPHPIVLLPVMPSDVAPDVLWSAPIVLAALEVSDDRGVSGRRQANMYNCRCNLWGVIQLLTISVCKNV